LGDLEGNKRLGFRNKHVIVTMLVLKIEEAAAMWCLAGPKALSNV
jgi:hypothetical protein